MSVAPQAKLVGASLVGVIISAPIYGITCGQTYLYYKKYSGDDRWPTKFMVAILWVLDSFHLALVIAMTYHYAIENWGDVTVLSRTTWTLQVQIVVALAVASIVQCFLARWIWRYSKNWILTGVIVILSLVQLGIGTGFMVHGFEEPFFTPKRSKTTTFLGCTALSTDIACDVLILVSMCYYLHKSRTGFKGTNTMINLLITYVIRTCLISTICTVSCLVTMLLLPDSLIYQPCFFIGTKLYASSLLSTLNARGSILCTSQPHGNPIISVPIFTTVFDLRCEPNSIDLEAVTNRTRRQSAQEFRGI